MDKSFINTLQARKSDQSTVHGLTKVRSQHDGMLHKRKPEIKASEHVSSLDTFPFHTRRYRHIKLLLGKSAKIIQYETASFVSSCFGSVTTPHDVTPSLLAMCMGGIMFSQDSSLPEMLHRADWYTLIGVSWDGNVFICKIPGFLD